jgi:hypothetical protein
MKKLKIVIIVIVLLVAIPLITALFVDGQYAVEREVTINKPKDVVFDYIKMLKNQDNYSVWAKMDPAMKKSFSGTDGTVGFISAWESDNQDVGKGEQEIKAIKDGERIDFEIRFMEPFEATDNSYMATEELDSALVKVKWGFNGEMAYPMNIMMLFMDMEEMIAGDLQTGLDNLKIELEKVN